MEGVKLDFRAKAALYECNIPKYMHDGLIGYVNDGIPVGDFLNCVLENDLRGAVQHADDNNGSRLKNYVTWLYGYAPLTCWGFAGAVTGWLALKRDEAVTGESDGK